MPPSLPEAAWINKPKTESRDSEFCAIPGNAPIEEVVAQGPLTDRRSSGLSEDDVSDGVPGVTKNNSKFDGQLSQYERKLAPGSILIAVASLRFLYRVTLHREWTFENIIPAPKKPQTLPVVLSPEEVLQFLSCVQSCKHRTILTICYATGLRISEATRLVHGILFRAAAETLRTIAADPKHLGAEIGFFAVLHTWGQNLLHHPHLHFVVAGGGLAPEGNHWISCRPGFFLPVRVLSRLFRRLFLKSLQKEFDSGKLKFFSSFEALQGRKSFLRYLAPARKAEWVIYAKPPFAGPQQVLDYVGRCTHRVALSNDRLLDMENRCGGQGWLLVKLQEKCRPTILQMVASLWRSPHPAPLSVGT